MYVYISDVCTNSSNTSLCFNYVNTCYYVTCKINNLFIFNYYYYYPDSSED